MNDQTEQYYEWLHDNTVDLNAPDYLVQMATLYIEPFPGSVRLQIIKQAMYDTLEYEIESISSDVLIEAHDLLLQSRFHSSAVRHGWLDKINEELEDRDNARRCPECNQLKETCEQYGHMTTGTLYEAPEWICGYEPDFDRVQDNR